MTWRYPKTLSVPQMFLLSAVYPDENFDSWSHSVRFNITFRKPLLRCFSSVQFSRSVVSDSLRPHESQHARAPCPSPSPGVHSDSTSFESVMPSSHLILGRPLLLLPPIPPSIGVFSNESTLHIRWPKYWSFSFSIIPSKEIPGLISTLAIINFFLSHSNFIYL